MRMYIESKWVLLFVSFLIFVIMLQFFIYSNSINNIHKSSMAYCQEVIVVKDVEIIPLNHSNQDFLFNIEIHNKEVKENVLEQEKERTNHS